MCNPKVTHGGEYVKSHYEELQCISKVTQEGEHEESFSNCIYTTLYTNRMLFDLGVIHPVTHRHYTKFKVV